MKIIFAGTPEVAVPGLQALLEAGHEVVGVITREDAPVGRKKIMTPSAVAVAANDRGLEVFKANRLDAAAVDWATRLGADLGVVIAYGGLLKRDLLDVPKNGWVNLHFSALPRWRGAAPVQRALMHGERDIGVTVFRLVEALDAGDIVAGDSFYFEHGTSAGAVLSELAERGGETLIRAIAEIERNPMVGTPQLAEASYAHKLDRADGKLDLTQSKSRVLAHWAGVTPEPGAWAEITGSKGETLKLLALRDYVSAVSVQDEVVQGEIGELVLHDGQVLLTLEDGHLIVDHLQPPGKHPMEAAAWLRGKQGARVVLQ